jgi:hypothetical protein
VTWISQVGYKYLSHVHFPVFSFLIFILVCIYPSIRLNKTHLLNRPNYKPFAWGYFLALVVVSWGLLIVALSIAVYPYSSPDWIKIWCIYLVILGVLMFRQNRWAWLVYIVLSINPAEWIINGIYLKNRWQEMKEHGKE